MGNRDSGIKISDLLKKLVGGRLFKYVKGGGGLKKRR